MRYIGSKVNLLSQLEQAVNERHVLGGVFCDIFSGTGAVGTHFKAMHQVISNDLLYFSHVLQFAKIQINRRPKFNRLKTQINSDPLEYLNNMDREIADLNSEPFIFEEFSPGGKAKRKYFTQQNALHIDLIRQTIEQWKTAESINHDEYMYLLASLIEAVPYVSNIAGTYGAYLKHWDKRANNPLVLKHLEVLDNRKENKTFNVNGNELIRYISGEVLYIDPPYNSRQYLGNYHVLETIAKYDYPALQGVTGMRADLQKSSDYCKTKKAHSAFNDLLANANFDFIFLSYNTEGLLSEDELISIFESHTSPQKIKIYRYPYRRYSRIKDPNRPSIEELIISGAR